MFQSDDEMQGHIRTIVNVRERSGGAIDVDLCTSQSEICW